MNVSEVIEKRRASWASRGVPVREESEATARVLLDEHAGSMTAEDFAAFCRAVNTTWRDGEMHYARFSPAFQGASMQLLFGDGEALNEWTNLIWRAGNDEDALAAVDEVLQHRDRLPGAGSSYPSVLMYLRDPAKYFPWTANLDKGLRECGDYDGAARSEGSDGYLRYCDAVRTLVAEHSLRPQEVDGILRDAFQSSGSASVRPSDLADDLGVPPEQIRAFLREVYPRGEEDHGQGWVLTPEQIDAVESHFGSAIEPEEEALINPWDEFVKWAKRCFEYEGFDEYERNFKLKVSDHLQAAARAIEADDGWFDLLKRSFGPPSNLTFFITHSRFLDWVKENQDAARAAMLQLWDEDRDLRDRIDNFSAALPDEVQGQGARLQIGSFLLLTRPFEYVIYRPTPFDTAIRLVDYADKPKSGDGDVYEHALGFLDEFMRQAEMRGLQLRDRLDAQSLVWSVAKANDTLTEVLGMPADEAEAFLRYVGARPSAWWVNQGFSYRFEAEHGIVQAPLKNKAGRDLQHWKNIELLRPGDVIVHYADKSIRALSVVSKRGTHGPRSWQSDEEPGRYAKTQYFELPEPLAASEIAPERRTPDAGPFDRIGGFKQVYLEPLSVAFSEYLKAEFRNKWPEGHPWAPQQRNTWLFQANPAVWDLEANLAAMEVGDEDEWTVGRYKAEIAEGDRVLLWQSGERAGLYGIGTISGELFERGPDDEHYTGSTDETAIPWRLTRKLDEPILRTDLMQHPTLGGLSVIAQPQGTNFRVTDEQWSDLRALIEGEVAAAPPVQPGFPAIALHVASQGLIISERTLRRFHVSLATRGFVILSGVSGTGKTWLTEVYAEAIGARYLLVPVAPNWTTNEDLLGYLNPIDGAYHDTAFSNFLREASSEYEAATAAQRDPRTFILTLDEMNLARVEYYFAKFLSAMEARTRYASAPVELSASETVQLTPNLLFIGTVNIDETTHGFADKVFDRAQLVELEAPREAIDQHIGQAAFRDTLLEFYDAVEEAKPFAFRVVDEVKSYVAESESLDVGWPEAIDEQMLQKVLPKLTGADPSIRLALEQITHVAENHGMRLTFDKATRMLHDYDRDGFTSYF